MQIYKFNDILKTVLWGGNKLTAFKGLPASDEPIGESWELSAVPGHESIVAEGPDKGLTLTELVQRYRADLVGENVYRRYGDGFPLLIKLIDAKRDLSIQVHPDDEMAQRVHGCSGKTEMWYVIDTDDGALIHTGFNRAITPEEFDRRLSDDTLMDAITSMPSKSGDVFFIPAGQIHAIGAGNLLAEIQQSSDITYRVYDYGRRDANGNLRELHTRQAREALNFDVVDSMVHYTVDEQSGVTTLVACPQFEVSRIDVAGDMQIELPDAFFAVVCIDGAVELSAEGLSGASLRRGETALVPAVARSLAISGKGLLLSATIR